MVFKELIFPVELPDNSEGVREDSLLVLGDFHLIKFIYVPLYYVHSNRVKWCVKTGQPLFLPVFHDII